MSSRYEQTTRTPATSFRFSQTFWNVSGMPFRFIFFMMLAGVFTRCVMYWIGFRSPVISSSASRFSSFVFTSRIAQEYSSIMSRKLSNSSKSSGSSGTGAGSSVERPFGIKPMGVSIV